MNNPAALPETANRNLARVPVGANTPFAEMVFRKPRWLVCREETPLSSTLRRLESVIHARSGA
jgi:hypothetical protein